MAIKFHNLARPKADPNLLAAQAQAMLAQAVALHQQGQLARAQVLYQDILKTQPRNFHALHLLGVIASQTGNFTKALDLIDQALTIKPDYPEAHSNRGNALKELRQFDAAISSYDQGLAFKPRDADLHYNRGLALQDLQQLDAAIASYDKAIAFRPDFAEAHCNRGLALQALKQLDAAVANYDKAIAIKPDYAEAHNNRGNTLKDLQQLDAAITSYDKAIAIKADYAAAYENRLFCLSRNHRVDARQLYSEHLAFSAQFEAPLRAGWLAHNNVKDPARRLQIGFVSDDLCDHPVASFLEPVLEFLSKKSGLSIHAYYTHALEDEVSRRLRTHCAHWHIVAGMRDADLANKIRADGIDILIDLAGHSGHNRLLTFARKPAPIQVSWIGYPGTTGLQAMDYILGDGLWIPQELAWQFTEKLAYLPASMVFQPSALAPPVGPLPALKTGYITFGSFNHASKITAAVIALWSSLLRSLPTARMSIGATAPDVHAALTRSFASEGISADRLTFFARVSAQEYQALHHQFDICLDTFPYGGATTTVQAGWMGVPTLTLSGETPPSRYGFAIMNHWGLDAFVATNNEDFVSKGLYWSNHIAELAAIRQEMRARFNASAMGQPEPFADSFETMLRVMWRRWCDDLPATTIDARDYYQ